MCARFMNLFFFNYVSWADRLQPAEVVEQQLSLFELWHEWKVQLVDGVGVVLGDVLLGSQEEVWTTNPWLIK